MISSFPVSMRRFLEDDIDACDLYFVKRVHGLEIGADDYMTKPFSPRELVLRVNALLRRSRSGAQNDVLEVDNFQVDRNSFGIRLEGRRLDLTSTEFKLLAALIERR